MSDAIGDRQNKALALYRQGKFGESNAVMMAMNAELEDNAQRYFLIGRNFLAQNDNVQAEIWFRKCVNIGPHIWAYYSLGILEQQRGDVTAAGHWILLGLNCGKGDAEARGYKDNHRATVLEIGHAVYAKKPELALGIYQKSADIGISDYRSSLRIVGGLISSGETEAAFERMRALRAGNPLDGEGLLCLSRLNELRGNANGARDNLRKAIASADGNPKVLIAAAARWTEMAMFEEAEELLNGLAERITELDMPEAAGVLDLETRLAATRGETLRLATLFADFEFSRRGMVIEPEVLEVARKASVYLEDNFTGSPIEVSGLLRFYARLRMTREADALLQKIKGQDVNDNPSIALRRLELFCAVADLDRAEKVYEEYFTGRELSYRENFVVVRFLAERKRWADAAAIIKISLVKGQRPPGLASQLLRVARRASEREELLALLDRAIEDVGAKVHRNAMVFRQLLIDDLCVTAGAETLTRPTRPGAADELSDANRFLSSQELATGTPLVGRTALYLCTDRAYFFGVLTFLASYAANNAPYIGKVKLIVFLSEDVPGAWHAVLSDFSVKIGLDVEILRETVFDTSNRTEHGSWGFFSGGGGLSRAAYFRLYAARYLINRREFDRLCYTDSDIVCHGDLGPLFAHDLKDNLIGARCEEMGSETSYAADFNSISRDAYFNSGVLTFDLTKPDIVPHLDRAIDLGENESHRLFFLDQCALNIAFENRASRLPAAFNTFIRPDQSADMDVHSARLLHFITSPKPWDTSYDRELRGLWRKHAEVVRLLIDRADFREIVGAANGVAAPKSDAGGADDKAVRSTGAPAKALDGQPLSPTSTHVDGHAPFEKRVITFVDGRKVSTAVAIRPGKPALFVLGVRKSGSSILSQITEALAIHNKVHFVDTAKVFFEQNITEKTWLADPASTAMLAEGNLYGVCRGMPLAFAPHPLFIAGKKVLMVRDPRDALVSQYFSNAFTHPIPEATEQGDEVRRLMIERRERALSMSLEESVIKASRNMNVTLMNYEVIRHDPNTLLFKYEDVILEKERLIRTMCSHFGWKIANSALTEILSWADVIPEKENQQAFVRKVIPGDHREKLSRLTIAKLNSILKPAMDLFGYAAD